MRVKIAALRAGLAQILARVRDHDERIVIVRHGEPVAALISCDELAEFDRLRRMYTTVPLQRRKEQVSSALTIG